MHVGQPGPSVIRTTAGIVEDEGSSPNDNFHGSGHEHKSERLNVFISSDQSQDVSQKIWFESWSVKKKELDKLLSKFERKKKQVLSQKKTNDVHVDIFSKVKVAIVAVASVVYNRPLIRLASTKRSASEVSELRPLGFEDFSAAINKLIENYLDSPTAIKFREKIVPIGDRLLGFHNGISSIMAFDPTNFSSLVWGSIYIVLKV